jgi:uncharacterized Fe-S cluster protein YjdI
MRKEYTKDNVTILWDSSICIHSAVCVKGLPYVFKPKDAPWIKIENDSIENIVEQVKKCPSGAISIK